MTKPSLSDRSKKDLADLAKRKGVRGWDRLSKDDLVKALSRLAAKEQPAAKSKAGPASRVKVATARVTSPNKKPAGAASAPSANGAHHANGAAKHKTPAKPSAPAAKAPATAAKLAPSSKVAPVSAKPALTPPKPLKPSAPIQTVSRPDSAPIPADKDLSTRSAKGTLVKDRIVLTAPDPYWLHAFWELSQQTVQRAEAALGQDWHGAKPIIRLLDVTSQDTTSTSESIVRDIVVHGGCNRWYIDVPQPPRSYRVDVGYLTRSGRFFPLSRSNVQTPPKSGASEVLDDGRGDGGSAAPTLEPEDTFRRPMKDTAFGTGAVLPGKLKKFFFDIDAELIVYGKTDPTAGVTLQNEPVKLRPDGTFTMRFSLPDSRQIIPAVATSTDGMEEQTIVLAVERNTKRLDPMIHDLYGEN